MTKSIRNPCTKSSRTFFWLCPR